MSDLSILGSLNFWLGVGVGIVATGLFLHYWIILPLGRALGFEEMTEELLDDRLTPEQEEDLLDLIAVQKRDRDDTGERITLEELAESVGIDPDDSEGADPGVR